MLDLHRLDRIEKKLDAIGRAVANVAEVVNYIAGHGHADDIAGLTAKLKASSDALAESVASAWQPIPVEPTPGVVQ